jgi:hypothetical protein
VNSSEEPSRSAHRDPPKKRPGESDRAFLDRYHVWEDRWSKPAKRVAETTKQTADPVPDAHAEYPPQSAPPPTPVPSATSPDAAATSLPAAQAPGQQLRTICPRCESGATVHLPQSVGFNQWHCNMCTHQWDFATNEERALVPDHLIGGKIEQFLEEFLAIKTMVKGESEQLWAGCLKAYELINATSLEDRARVFCEQVERWRDRLRELQEVLILDRLLPLIGKYEIARNEQNWLAGACYEAWKPVRDGYNDWFVVAMRGCLVGPGDWVIPEWAWQLPGAPRGLAQLDIDRAEKVSPLLHGLAGALESELLLTRKSTIARAFLAQKSGTPAQPGLIANEISVQPSQGSHLIPEPMKMTSGRPPRLSREFVQFVGKLWLDARRQSIAAKVTHNQLTAIAIELDKNGYTPPAKYLEKKYADALKEFNSHNSNSQRGPIKTWSQLVEIADKDHLRGMRKLLSRCSKNKPFGDQTLSGN